MWSSPIYPSGTRRRGKLTAAVLLISGYHLRLTPELVEPLQMNAVAIALHVVAAMVWIGGLFFAYIILRPSANALEAPQRLQLWAGVFKRFFPWVWMAIVVLMITGYLLIFNWFNGFGSSPAYVHLMHLLGWVMALLFVYLYYKLYPSFVAAVKVENWPEAGVAMNRIRQIVLINLILGIMLLLAVSSMQRLTVM